MLNQKRKWVCGRGGCKKPLWNKSQEAQHLRSAHARNTGLPPIEPWTAKARLA